MGLYQSKLFLTLDDVADYLADKGICDFDVQNKHEKKRFKDFIQELELMHDLKRLKLIDGEFDVDFSIVEEDKTEDKFNYHLALQLKNYNLAGFFYPNGVNSQDEPCYSALHIMKSWDDYHDGYLSDLLKHYRQVPPELEHLISKHTLTLSDGKTVTTTRTKVFVTDEGNVYKENGYSSTYKIGVIDNYYRYVDIDVNFVLKSKYNKSKDYFFINNLEKAIASYRNLANEITAGEQSAVEIEEKEKFALNIDEKKENKIDWDKLRNAIDLAMNPLFKSDDYFLENPEPPELKVIDFTDDGEQSELNDSQQQIADLQARIKELETAIPADELWEDKDPRTINNLLRLLLAINEMAKAKNGNYVDFFSQDLKNNLAKISTQLDLLGYKRIGDDAYIAIRTLIREKKDKL